MIDSIKFKNKNSLTNEYKEIDFGKKNVIIGPKGGGKSTLFDILANVKDGNIFSSSIDALAEFDLELVSVTRDGEELPLSALTKIKIKKGLAKSKDIAERYSNRNDVLYQDDSIKKNLSDTKDFNKQKMEFAKKIVSESQDAISFINKIVDFKNSVLEVVDRVHNANINLSVAFKIKDSHKKPSSDLLFQLSYNSSNILIKSENDINKLKEEKKTFTEFKNKTNALLTSYKNQDGFKFVESEFIEKSIKWFESTLKTIEERIELLSDEINKVNIISKLAKSFDKAYNSVVSEIKRAKNKEDSEEKIIANYLSSSKNHFRNMANLLKNSNQKFDRFIKKEIPMEFKDSVKITEILSLSLDGNIKYEEEEKVDILKAAMYNAKKVQTNYVYWIQSAIEKGEKAFDNNKILNKIAEKVKSEVKVLADGEDYDVMSLGQKSIYGIKYKLSKTLGQTMYLDQPEDNLDNNTIATEILKLMDKNYEQVFTVTHNANIGILSHPDKVIIGNFDKGTEDVLGQYKEGIIEEVDNHSDSAMYLEGGVNSIVGRYKIITGNKGVNNEN